MERILRRISDKEAKVLLKKAHLDEEELTDKEIFQLGKWNLSRLEDELPVIAEMYMQEICFSYEDEEDGW